MDLVLCSSQASWHWLFPFLLRVLHLFFFPFLTFKFVCFSFFINSLRSYHVFWSYLPSFPQLHPDSFPVYTYPTLGPFFFITHLVQLVWSLTYASLKELDPPSTSSYQLAIAEELLAILLSAGSCIFTSVNCLNMGCGTRLGALAQDKPSNLFFKSFLHLMYFIYATLHSTLSQP